MIHLPPLPWPAFLLFLCLAPPVAAFQVDHQSKPAIEALDIAALTTIASRNEALQKLQADQIRLRASNDLAAIVQTTNSIAQLRLKLNDLESAFDSARDALSLARQLGNQSLLVDTLVLFARVNRHRQDNQGALRLLTEANQLSIRLKYRQGEARSLTELGATYYPLSEFPKAQGYTEQAVQIWRELDDKRGEAAALIGLGEIHMRLGKSQEATTALESAASLWRELGSSADQATALVDLNFLSIRQGEWQKAMSLLGQAQNLIIEKEAEPYLAGQIANSLGEVYEVYGKLEIALAYYEEAVRLYRDFAHDPSAAIDVTRQAGRVRARLGDYDQAIQEIEEALKLAKQIDSPAVVIALCHEDLGIVHLENGFNSQAREEFLAAISGYPRTGSWREWARAQTFLGQTEYSLGNFAAAAGSYQKALKVFADNKDYTNEASLSFGLGKLALKQNRLEEAGKHLKRSIALTEQLRENAASKDLRSSYLGSVHERYETYVEWLMTRHASESDNRSAIEAFEASESGRARSLVDSLRDYQREMRQVSDPALLITEELLQKQEQGLIDKRATLLSEGASREARSAVESELREIRSRYEALEAQINSSSRFTNLLRPTALSYEEIRSQVTNAETTLLEYSLGDQRSYLWVVTPDGIHAHELAGRETIENAVRRLAELLSNRPTDSPQGDGLRTAIDEVSRLILGPAGEQLQARRLVIVPDGILQYIPFQVLNSPSTKLPLVAQHEIVNAPSASTLVMVHQESVSRATGPQLLAAFGDPILRSGSTSKEGAAIRGVSEEKLTGSNREQQQSEQDRSEESFSPGKLQPLLFTRIELNELRKLAQQDGSVVYSGSDATRDNLRGLDLSQYRILHFATHGFIDSRQAELSGLVLSLVGPDGQPDDGFVGLYDIYRLRAPVALVVLSACRTALGKDVRGEGLIGLTRGFMYAGASSVVASLWKVDDEATSELMKRFYTNMLQKGMTPAAALRSAQISISQEPQWSSPYYWAAFTLQGDYRQVIRPGSTTAAAMGSRIIAGLALVVFVMGLGWWWYRGRRGRRRS